MTTLGAGSVAAGKDVCSDETLVWSLGLFVFGADTGWELAYTTVCAWTRHWFGNLCSLYWELKQFVFGSDIGLVTNRLGLFVRVWTKHWFGHLDILCLGQTQVCLEIRFISLSTKCNNTRDPMAADGCNCGQDNPTD